jgi:hypothetical protein
MFGDQHFVNRKYLTYLILNFLVLGDLLGKKPGARKVDAFISKQLKLKIDGMLLDAQIQDSFQKMNSRLNKRLQRLQQMEQIQL